MGTYLVYVDESYNDDLFCLSAMILKATDWRDAFKAVKDHRAQLKERYAIPLRKEIHARELVGGRGRLGPNDIGKWERSRIFRGLLELVTTLPSARLFNVALQTRGEADPQLKAWDRLLNRVDRTLKAREDKERTVRRKIHEVIAKHAPELADSAELRLQFQGRALFIADEGRNVEITRIMRKMNVHNPIPSAFGGWPEGAVRNTPTERIIEDPVFRQSESSYMLQLVDCVAFALLKREADPTQNIKRYGIHKMFDELLPSICVKAASRTDPLGIVRN
ncbi:MAG TPA: DUF3800 domain-containing protein [Kofleriaceae bacterium]|nr:DUF3800 domain-containing protein [Kofleriaceae bacterium]